MTPEQLKASILQQAMEGKLVKQDPNDEPASILVKKIADEKARLIKEKKIKRTRKLPDITDDEESFNIPDSWEWERLGNLSFSIRYGFTDSAKENGNSKFVRITDIQKGKVNWDNVPFCNVPDDKLDDLKLQNKDILIARTGGTVGKSFIVNNVPQISVFASYLIRIRIGNTLLTDFISYFLQSPLYWKAISEKQNGTGQPNVNATKLGSIALPLPPLAEQKRIVAKIEKLMPLVNEYAESYNRLVEIDTNFNDQMKQSILQYAMEGKLVKQDPNDEPASVLVRKIADEKVRLIKEKKIKRTKELPEITADEKPFDIPDSWEWIRFGDLVNFRLGKTPQKTNNNYWSNGVVPWVAISDMQEPTLTKTKLMISDGAFKEVFKQRMVPKGTLLMSFKLSIGKVTILNINAVHNEAIIDIQPYIDNNNIQRNYLFCVLPFISNMGQTNTAIKGKTLNKTSLNNMVIPLPPLAEQKRIVDKVEQIMNLLFD